jgi:hypothetical protein
MEAQLLYGGRRRLLDSSSNVAATCAVVLFGVFAYNSYRERLSDKRSGGPAGKRQTCELDFKI